MSTSVGQHQALTALTALTRRVRKQDVVDGRPFGMSIGGATGRQAFRSGAGSPTGPGGCHLRRGAAGTVARRQSGLLNAESARLVRALVIVTDHRIYVIFVSDQLDWCIPALTQIHDRFWAGDLAQWSNLAGGGSPLLANPDYGVFSPGRWVFLLLPPWLAPGWAKLLEMAFAWVFSYLLVRRLSGSRIAAALAGVVYPLTGFIIGWTNWPAPSPGPYRCLLVHRAVRQNGRCAAPCRSDWPSRCSCSVSRRSLDKPAPRAATLSCASSLARQTARAATVISPAWARASVSGSAVRQFSCFLRPSTAR